MIKNIFWNQEEKRIRMLWRLLGQVLILLPFMFGLQILVGAAAFALQSARGGMDPAQLTDPGAAQQMITGSPVLMLFSTVSTGIALVISIWIAGRLLDRRRFADFGLHFDRDWWMDFGFGLGLGGVLMGLIFILEYALGWVAVTGTLVTRDPGAAFLPALLPPLVIFLAVGFYEELFSRGYQLTNLAEGLSGKLLGDRGAIATATLLSSAVFGILHATNPNASAFSTFNIAVAGIFLAAGFLLTGELAIPIGCTSPGIFSRAMSLAFRSAGQIFARRP